MHSLLAAALFALAAQPAAVEADYVLKNATIVDGTGNPGVLGDLAIRGDRIVALGKFDVAGKPRVLDCTGLILAPGFIDLHNHSDMHFTAENAACLNYLTQGLTTTVTGNCGFGPVDVPAYFKKMEDFGLGTNLVHQMPHNAIREQAMGNENRPPTDKELRLMEELVDKGMQDGAWGLSTGLIYNPGTYAKTDEIIALAKVAAKHGGLYASHIRDEYDNVLIAVEEVLTIARRAGIRVHISHIKVHGRSAWGKSGDVVALIRRARKEGLTVTADQYPYIASSTSLTATIVPSRYREGSDKDLVKRLDDPDIGPKMKADIARKLDEQADVLQIASYTATPAWQGKNLLAIARAQKRPVLDIALEILRNGGASVVNFGMNEEDLRLFMKEPYVATASDGSAMVPASTVPHPRSYGTFPRKIARYALQDKVVTLEQAIRSSSGLPADILKLPQRGYLKTGYFADLVLFDPKTFRDTATYEQPHQYSTGVQYLFINGRLVIDHGRFTGVRAGRPLRFKV